MRLRFFISSISAVTLFLMVPDSMTKAQAVAYLATYYVLARLFWLAVEEITRECREQLAARGGCARKGGAGARTLTFGFPMAAGVSFCRTVITY